MEGGPPAHRVLVIGICGAGKSTLAVELGRRLDLPVVHLDKHYWRPGWSPTPEDEWQAHVASLVAGERWVIDGNYSSTQHLRFPAADTIVDLDFPRRIALPRVIRRVVTSYGRVRWDLGEGCPERFDWEFLRFVWDFPRLLRPGTDEALRRFAADKRVVRLTHPKEVRRFLRSLPSVVTSSNPTTLPR